MKSAATARRKFLARQFERDEADLLVKIFSVEQLIRLNRETVNGLLARGWLIKKGGRIIYLSDSTRQLLAVQA